MASRVARRFISSSRLASPRPRTQSFGVIRRHASTEAGSHSPKADSDTPWIIGSAVILGPAFLYAVSLNFGSKKSHEDHGHGHAESKKPVEAEPMKDDEGTEASGADIANSLATAEKDDAPQSDGASIPPADAKPVADDEGTEASGEEVKQANQQAAASDSPKVDKEDPHADGHPALTSEAETDVEQKEKPASGKKEGPGMNEPGRIEMGEARQAAKSGTPPKKVEEQSQADENSKSDKEDN